MFDLLVFNSFKTDIGTLFKINNNFKKSTNKPKQKLRKLQVPLLRQRIYFPLAGLSES